MPGPTYYPEYRPRRPVAQDPPSPRWHGTIGCVAGVVVTPVALYLALVSTGAGHGSYGAAALLYPYAMMSMILTGGAFPPLVVALAVLQFPMYGLVIGRAALRGWRPMLVTAGIIFGAHAVVVLTPWLFR